MGHITHTRYVCGQGFQALVDGILCEMERCPIIGDIMAHQRHGVVGQSDPNFKPDPNVKMKFDKDKGVYRKVLKSKPKK